MRRRRHPACPMQQLPDWVQVEDRRKETASTLNEQTQGFDHLETLPAWCIKDNSEASATFALNICLRNWLANGPYLLDKESASPLSFLHSCRAEFEGTCAVTCCSVHAAVSESHRSEA